MSKKHFLEHMHKVVADHTDDLVAFGSGAGVGLWHWLRLHPEVVVGKLLATLVLGFFGGVGGVLGKKFISYLFGGKKSNTDNP